MKRKKYQHGDILSEKQCYLCHEVHTSKSEYLLKGFSLDLCIHCHNQQIRSPRGDIENIQAQIERVQYLHGPVAQKNCTPCHFAHGGDYPNLMIRPFPEDFYVPFTVGRYGLCFGCHDSKMVLEKLSMDTQFRNGNENLHYFHVNDPLKGRSCRACHAEHASDNPFHIRDSVPFGKWTMRIIFKQTSTGGSCLTGCHQERGYDRESPIPYEDVRTTGALQ